MSEPIWNQYLTERDKAVFAASGYGTRGGFGKRPALLVIDVNWAFCGERPEPILQSIKRWRTSCGEEAWLALEHIKALIEKAHGKGLPVIYTTGERRADNWDAGSWRWKSTRGEESHALSLCDMHAKYADVVPTAEILSYFDRLRLDLFDLPTGSSSPLPPIKDAAE